MAIQRKRKSQEDSEDVEITVTQVKPKWKVTCGGITLRNRQSYSVDDVFEADEDEIPLAFRDGVSCVTPEIITQKTSRPQPEYSLMEIVPTAEEMDESGYVQLYNIINESDKVVSEKPLTKEEAEPIIKGLNK
jgi:hypothetical protein